MYVQHPGGEKRKRTAPDISAAAFDAVETHKRSNGNVCGGGGGGGDDGCGVVLHCVDYRGTIFEASTVGGGGWNAERDDSIFGTADGGGGGGGGGTAVGGRGWHLCADVEASLLVRETGVYVCGCVVVAPVVVDSHISS